MRSSCLVGAAVGAAVALSAHAAAAKPRPACGLDYLPLTEGTTWRYEFTVPPDVAEPPGPRTVPPPSLEIEVKSVEAKGGATEITVEERFRDVVVTTTLRCSKDGLEVPLDSFFFAGEPGGGRGMTASNLQSKGELYPGSKGLRSGDSLYVILKADVERTAGDTEAVHPKAKLEIERLLNVGSPERVSTGAGDLRATKVEVVLSGRAALEPKNDEKVNMPETRSQLWFASGVGLVQAYNSLGHGWGLAEVVEAE